MDCKEVCETVFLFVDNEMGDDLQISFRDHVERCPGCADRMNYTRKFLFVIRERCTRCCAPDTLRHRILTSMPHRRSQIRPI